MICRSLYGVLLSIVFSGILFGKRIQLTRSANPVDTESVAECKKISQVNKWSESENSGKIVKVTKKIRSKKKVRN